MEQHDARPVDAVAMAFAMDVATIVVLRRRLLRGALPRPRIRAFPRRAPSPPTFEMSMARDALLAGRLMGLDNHRESVRERVKWQNIRGE